MDNDVDDEIKTRRTGPAAKGTLKIEAAGRTCGKGNNRPYFLELEGAGRTKNDRLGVRGTFPDTAGLGRPRPERKDMSGNLEGWTEERDCTATWRVGPERAESMQATE